MAIEIKVPSPGESISEVTVSKWLKQVGDYVKLDEPLVELESEKATFEVNAEAAGVCIFSLKMVMGERVWEKIVVAS